MITLIIGIIMIFMGVSKAWYREYQGKRTNFTTIFLIGGGLILTLFGVSNIFGSTGVITYISIVIFLALIRFIKSGKTPVR